MIKSSIYVLYDTEILKYFNKIYPYLYKVSRQNIIIDGKKLHNTITTLLRKNLIFIYHDQDVIIKNSYRLNEHVHLIKCRCNPQYYHGYLKYDTSEL